MNRHDIEGTIIDIEDATTPNGKKVARVILQAEAESWMNDKTQELGPFVAYGDKQVEKHLLGVNRGDVVKITYRLGSRRGGPNKEYLNPTLAIEALTVIKAADGELPGTSNPDDF